MNWSLCWSAYRRKRATPDSGVAELILVLIVIGLAYYFLMR